MAATKGKTKRAPAKKAAPVKGRTRRTRESKTPPETPLRVPTHGNGKLRVGGTNKGGPGRPPNEFKAWCAGLLDDADNRLQVELILGNKDHPAFKEMWKAIADRAHGKPKEHVQVDMNDDFGNALKAARLRAANR